jgi:hypothetical protein
VAEFILTLLLGLPVLFLWLVVVPLIVRPFGVRLPLAPFSFTKRRSAFENLTFSQHVLINGFLAFGCGMFIYKTLSDYLGWKYFHDRPLTSVNLLDNALSYLLVGSVLYGLISWPTRSRGDR